MTAEQPHAALLAALQSRDAAFPVSAHFKLGELIHSDTAERQRIDNWPRPGAQPIALDELATNLALLCANVLEPLRLTCGPFTPNSVFRSAALNAAIGGQPASQHCLGQAADIEIPGIANDDLAHRIERAWRFDQLILESHHKGQPTSGWVHVSFKAVGNRRQSLTILADGTHIAGLAA